MDKLAARLLVTQTVALGKSVTKWERILSDIKSDDKKVIKENGDKDCACCKKFLVGRCIYCPISLYTNRVHCINTPYDDWRKAVEEFDNIPHIKKTRLTNTTLRIITKAASDELTFLKKLHNAYQAKVRKAKAETLSVYTVLGSGT